MKRQIKLPPKHDNVTPEMAKKAVASVMYKEPQRRLMMTDAGDVGYSKREPTLSDIQTYLADRGLVAVPLEPTEAMLKAAMSCPMPLVMLDSISAMANLCTAARYKAMIAAQGEE